MLNFSAIIPGMAGWAELLLILALVLILFGPKRLPEIAEAMGKSIRKFKSATRDATDEVQREFEDAKSALKDDGTSEAEDESNTKNSSEV